MADEVKIQIREGLEVPVVEAAVPTLEDPSQVAAAPTTSSSLETKRDEEEAQRPASGAAANVQIERSSAENENSDAAEGERDVQFGAVVAFLSFAVMLPGFSFSSTEAKGPENWRFDILMLFEFASCICGLSFMILSMQFLGPPGIRVSSYYQVISRCLFYACIIFPALTLLSLLLVMPFKLYLYVGLAVPPLVPVAVGLVQWYVNRKVEGAPEPDTATELQELKEQMDANFKITGTLMASSFGGLVGTLAGVFKEQSGDAGDSHSLRATHIAVMFMFSTAVVSVLVMILSIKVMDFKNRELRRSIVRAIGHATVILICLLAIAAFSAAFVILKLYILTAFVSLALAAMVHFIIKHCTTARADADDEVEEGRKDDSNVSPNPNGLNLNEETQLGGWMADIGKQVTACSLGGVMMFFGSFIGDASSKQDKKAANMTCMFLLTSAFASGLGLMFLNFRASGPARGGFGAAINILAFSALGMIAAAALAIYGEVVMKS